MQIGPNLKALREAAGLSKKELAAKARCNPRTISRAEKDESVSRPILGRIAAALDVTLDVLDPAAELDVPVKNTSGGPHPGFVLLTISGPSAVGKDVVLSSLMNHAFEAFEGSEVWTKYTTRPKRMMDHPYYKFVSAAEFRSQVEAGEVVYPYWKRNHGYGFDRTHLEKASTRKILLFAIFTEFDLLPKAQADLTDSGLRTLSLLLDATAADLLERSGHRNLEPADVRARIDSITSDVKYIDANREVLDDVYDMTIANGNDVPKNATVEHVIRFVEVNTRPS